MKQLIYASTPDESVTLSSVQFILTNAIVANGTKRVSGMLVYNGKYFLQCIEGSDEAIDELFEKIKVDGRHANLKLIGTIDIEKRDFEAWNMGYVNTKSQIKKVIHEECGKNEFDPYDFTFLEAKNILKRLSLII
jgi:hypothetical protein